MAFPSRGSRLLSPKPGLFVFQPRAGGRLVQMLGKSMERVGENVNVSSKIGSKTITPRMTRASLMLNWTAALSKDSSFLPPPQTILYVLFPCLRLY